MDRKKAFGVHLKMLREERGLNQEELGEAVGGLSRGSISYYEKGERIPDMEMACRLAEFFGVSADYMVGLTDVRRHDIDAQAMSRRLALSDTAIKVLSDYAEGKAGEYETTTPVIHHLLDNFYGDECQELLSDLFLFFITKNKSPKDLEEQLLSLKITKDLYAFKEKVFGKSE